ncbi:MAG: tetratricopeptide repeat protein [Sedimentisphaerales bacterium]
MLKKYRVILICLVLAAATLVAYEPIRHNGFVDYDDDVYITENSNVQSGITQQSVKWAFTSLDKASNWHPLTWLSHMLDYKLFGPNPLGHHLVSVSFHIVNSLLVFLILTNCTGSIWPSAFVAAVFALHPLQVDSVAWSAERKTVVSGLFWFLTMAIYIWYTKKPGIWRYIAVFAIYGLSILTKPVVVTLPLVLLLMDYWPLGRFNPGRCTGGKFVPAKLLLLEKVPLLALSAFASAMTVIAQRGMKGVVITLEDLPLQCRIANVFLSYIRYIGKMLWPSKLAVFYPHFFTSDFPWDIAAGCAILFVMITIFFIFMALRRRYLLFGWLWFTGTLIPVIGLVQAGSQSIANRYMYIPIIGLLIIIGWTAKEFIAGKLRPKIIAAATVSVLLFCLMILTREQVKHWENSLKLFEYAEKCTKMNMITEGSLGQALLNAGRLDEAELHLKNAISVGPKNARITYLFGKTLLRRGKVNEAITYFKSIEAEIGREKYSSEIYTTVGEAYVLTGQNERAIQNYKRAVVLNHNNIEALNNLAWLLATRENISIEDSNAAVQCAERLCKLTGNKNISFLDTLAATYAAAGRFDEAIKTAEKAITGARAAGQEELAREIEGRLQLYQKGMRYIQK